jgi:hypothetical protein
MNQSRQYFVDGITDELITDLAKIRELRVISRTSVMPYKGVAKSLGTIAGELNVDDMVRLPIWNQCELPYPSGSWPETLPRRSKPT